MAKIATSIEESKMLLELGIDTNTANMRWYREQKWFPYELQPYPYNESIITDDNEFMWPAWSLGALIKVYLMLDNDARITFDNRDTDNDLIGSMVYAIEHHLKAKTTG